MRDFAMWDWGTLSHGVLGKRFGTVLGTVNVAGAREKVGSSIVQQSGIQCFNRKEYGHFAKECRKPKRIKDCAYHKEKMLMYKQAEQGVPLQAEQYDWLADTDEEVDEQELEAHYIYMDKIQEVPTADSGIDSEPVEHVQNDAGYNVFANDLQHSEQSESISNTCLVETDDINVIPDSPDMCKDDIQNEQNDAKSDDERVALANLIANLKLDVDENKRIQKQLKKANTTLAQELKECKTILAETSKSLGESISVRDSFLVALQTKQTEFEKYKAFNDRTIDYDKLEHMDEEVDEQELEAHYSYMVKIQEVPRADSGIDSELVEQVQNEARYNVFANHLQHSVQFESVSNTCLVETDDSNVIPDSPDMCEDDIQNEQNNVESDDERVNHKPTVSRPLLKSNQSRDKVLPNNSQMKAKKTQVEVHPRILSVSNKMKSVASINGKKYIMVIVDDIC
nr:hypothetical protein [Tanacetum cinerariifolium]